jgi:hypothetical protein
MSSLQHLITKKNLLNLAPQKVNDVNDEDIYFVIRMGQEDLDYCVYDVMIKFSL